MLVVVLCHEVVPGTVMTTWPLVSTQNKRFLARSDATHERLSMPVKRLALTHELYQKNINSRVEKRLA